MILVPIIVMEEHDENDVGVGSQFRRVLSTRQEFAADEAKKKNLMKKMSVLLAAPSLDEEMMASGRFVPVYVAAFLYFDGPLNIAKIRDTIKERLFDFPRFRSRIVSEKQGKQDVYNFVQMPIEKIPMDQLVQEMPKIKTSADMNKFVSDVYDRKVDIELPLWRAYVMNNMADGRSCLCWIIDHTISDGTGLIAVLLSILDDKEKAEKAVPKGKRDYKGSGIGCFTAIKSSLGACFNVFIGDQLPGDPMSKLKMKDHRNPTRERALSSSPGLSIDKVKEVAKYYPGATMNDVLMAVVCLTLRAYHEKYEPATVAKPRKFRANFPISLRKAGEKATDEVNLGNRFAPGNLDFPIHIDDPCKIVYYVKAQIDKIKVSPEPFMRDKLTGLLANSGMRKTTIMELVLDAYGKVTAMLSNVPGPQTQVSFAGKPISDISFYGLAPIGLYFGIVSYNGKLSCGIAVSADLEPNAANLSDLWEPSFKKLYEATMVHKDKGIVPKETTCCG